VDRVGLTLLVLLGAVTLAWLNIANLLLARLACVGIVVGVLLVAGVS
jgi:hypothetical protein